MSSPSQAVGGIGPSDCRSQSCLTHFFVDVQYAEDSTYDIEERHVPIDPTFHAHLQDHQEDNISNFLVLPEVIPAMKRKRAQPLLDFSKSKILTSLAYTEACEQLLAQRSAHEAEAKRKVAEREATKESRLKAKEERQVQVQERVQAREVKRRERERLQAEKLVEKLTTGGWRQRCTTEGSVANGVAPAQVQLPQHAGATTPNMRFPSPQVWAGRAHLNPMSFGGNPPYYYNPLVVPHIFPTGSHNINVAEGNSHNPWLGNGAWEAGARGADQRIQRHC